MSRSEVAVLLMGTSLIAAIAGSAGCGRIGFGAVGGDDTAPGGDDASNAVPCTASTRKLSNSTSHSEHSVLVWNGTHAGVAWLEDPAAGRFVKFAAATLEGPDLEFVDLGQSTPVDLDVAWDGASWQVAWGSTSTDGDIFRWVYGDVPGPLTTSARVERGVRIASLPAATSAYLWTALNPSGLDFALLLSVIDASGDKILDEAPIVTAVPNGAMHDLVWTGSELVVFYATVGAVTMQRLTSTGTPIGGPIPISNDLAVVNLAASWTGERFLVTWFTGSLRIASLSPTGTLLSPIRSAPGSLPQSDGVTIAAGDRSDLAVWNDTSTGSAHLMPLSRDGTLGPLTTLPLTGALSAAWTGSGWALATSEGMPAEIVLHHVCL